ncbi:hypothetical protein [Planctomyces sp. SH-PL62]|uniref:hypothetical protein n=1 Tax=Planctomyces sp. SH-PL62 TaxID=1636152 RepID=UPI0012E82042|nr:hypothetical protein [Planctomyces sp. SH-PL62]
MKPKAFERCFRDWLAGLQAGGSDKDAKAAGCLVAIDFMTRRGAKYPSEALISTVFRLG